DNVPFLNIMPFGTCMSIANPAVAAATAAALGVLTPAPCIPATVAPWGPGVPTVLVGNIPPGDAGWRPMCSSGGAISVVTPSQTAASGGEAHGGRSEPSAHTAHGRRGRGPRRDGRAARVRRRALRKGALRRRGARRRRARG